MFGRVPPFKRGRKKESVIADFLKVHCKIEKEKYFNLKFVNRQCIEEFVGHIKAKFFWYVW